MNAHKKSQSIGRYFILTLLVLLAILVAYLIISKDAGKAMAYYLDKIYLDKIFT